MERRVLFVVNQYPKLTHEVAMVHRDFKVVGGAWSEDGLCRENLFAVPVTTEKLPANFDLCRSQPRRSAPLPDAMASSRTNRATFGSEFHQLGRPIGQDSEERAMVTTFAISSQASTGSPTERRSIRETPPGTRTSVPAGKQGS
jgi:hypothetical protein